MKEPRFLFVCLIGAAAGLVFARAEAYYSNCIVGSYSQESVDVAAHRSALIYAVRRSYPYLEDPEISLNEATQRAIYAWSHLQDCVLVRGLEKCQALGTEEVLRVAYEEEGGPPFEEHEQYRYRLPADTLGGRFEMSFRLKTLSEWTEISISFLEEPRTKLEASFLWQRCVEKVSRNSVRSFRMLELGGNTND